MTRAGRFLGRLILVTAFIASSFTSISADRLPAVTLARPQCPQFYYATPELWAYLRVGLNYLESPKPLDPPESVPATFVHPDARGFGSYGFSPEAYEDVQLHYSFFRAYSWEDMLGSAELYDLANQAFADLLLKNLRGYIPEGADKKAVFIVLHQAWNLGLSGFKKGRPVVSSRTRRAEEFLHRPSLSSKIQRL